MKKEDVPVYNDPDDFIRLGDDAKFPCDTQYMEYNPMLHRYSLTVQGLQYYGVDISVLQADELNLFIDKVSKKVYDYIQYRSGWRGYQVQMYRIATAPKTIYPNQYYMRKQFEQALAEQARFLIENGDSAMVSSYRLTETPRPPNPPHSLHRDTSDIAPETIRTLETLGLTRWFMPAQFIRLDPNKF